MKIGGCSIIVNETFLHNSSVHIQLLKVPGLSFNTPDARFAHIRHISDAQIKIYTWKKVLQHLDFIKLEKSTSYFLWNVIKYL